MQTLRLAVAVRTDDAVYVIALQYYLLMSTRDDWLHATLVPSTIAASAPYPHGYVSAQRSAWAHVTVAQL